MFTNKIIIAFFAYLILFCVQLSAQSLPQNPNKRNFNGKKEGKWTVYYTQNWEETRDTSQVVFYRIANYLNGAPQGKVTDYYRNGKMQMEADAMLSETPEVYDGLVINYLPNGRIESFKYYEKGVFDYFKSEIQYLKQLGIEARNSGKSSGVYFGVLNALIKFYLDNGNFLKAEPLQRESTMIIYRMVGEKHPNFATMMYNQALIYRSMGNFAMAEENYLQVLKIRKENLGEKHPSYATVLKDLGNLYVLLGNFVRAEPYYQQALAIRKEVLGEKHQDYATSLNDLADMHYRMGNYKQAEENYLQASKIYLQTLGAEHEYYATSLNNLANLYEVIEQPERALKLLQQAKDIYLKKLGDKNSIYATALNNLAFQLSKSGQYEAAQIYQNQALKIRKDVLGEEHPDYANSLHNQGLLQLLKGDFSKAEQDLLQAKELRKQILGENHPDYLETLRTLCKLYTVTKKYTLAQPIYKQINLILLQQKDTYFPILSEKEKEEFYNNKIKAHFEEYNSFILENYPSNPELIQEMYNNQLATKAALLNDSNKWKEMIINSKDSVLLDKFNAWRNIRSYLNKIQSEQMKLKKNLVLDSLEQLSNSLEKELSKQSAYFAKMTDNKKCTWQDVQKALDKDEAAIEIIKIKKFGIQTILIDSTSKAMSSYPRYGLTDSLTYVALIIKKNTQKQPEIVVLPESGNALEKRYLNFYRNYVKFKINDKKSYVKYWLPIDQKLKGINKISLSLEGVYNQINLNTLYNEKSKKFLLQEKNIFLVTNTQELTNRAKTDFQNSSALFFGAPNYDLDNENREKIVGDQRSMQRSFYNRSVERSLNLSVERGLLSVERSVERNEEINENNDSPNSIASVEREAVSVTYLPGTKTEVQKITNLLTNNGLKPSIFMENEALEENLKDFHNPGILHIATHGFFQDDLNYSSKQTSTSNPLIRSGLLLTGSAHSLNNRQNTLGAKYIEDGILTAFEAMNLHLDKTELVVLSACETGLGEIKNGEGVYGLQRAFKVAGAKSIIMSLWKVDDATTQELMYLFYKNWLDTKNKHLAFKKAQISLMKKYPEPYFWGAFVLMGE